MSRFGKLDILSFVLPIASAGLAAALYVDLPATMATHFDMHGVANGWMPKMYGAFVIPAVSVTMSGLLARTPAVPPIARATAAGTLAAVQILLLHAALHPEAAMAGMPLLLGAGWIALGQILPRVRRNPLVGVRTPWTLASDEVWLRTHRVAAYTFTAGGLVSVLASMLPKNAAAPVMVTALLVSALVPALYSFRIRERAPL